MNNPVILSSEIQSLNKKVSFLSKPESYGDTEDVQAVETHMSWVFLTDKYVYKLKKPVSYPFLDFTTISARYKYCNEEVRLNRPLAGGVYLGAIPLMSFRENISLDGKGDVIDWLVKMKRLPAKYMLDECIKEGTVRNDWVRKAAEKLVDFYLQSTPVNFDTTKFCRQLTDDIELNCAALLQGHFGLQEDVIRRLRNRLVDFVADNRDSFSRRIEGGRIIDAHGDLRPDHICLGPDPVIIDRLEFNSSLRIMDIAEELAFLSLECDMLLSPEIGDLFLNVYEWERHDIIPEMLLEFYKAKRAFLRARLSISHLLEERYSSEERKWKTKCEAYLNAASAYCQCLPDN
jgi:aminoglycoside phosphotransferase family enzyme